MSTLREGRYPLPQANTNHVFKKMQLEIKQFFSNLA